MKHVKPLSLFRSSRPGYRSKNVSPSDVTSTLEIWKHAGVKSIICLLDNSQLAYYDQLPEGLLAAYHAFGFEVAHCPVVDHQYPPMTESELKEVEAIWESLPKPVLLHCSAGIDRTGAVVQYLLEAEHNGDV
jgi:protein tyrosine/serine phosphatase